MWSWRNCILSQKIWWSWTFNLVTKCRALWSTRGSAKGSGGLGWTLWWGWRGRLVPSHRRKMGKITRNRQNTFVLSKPICLTYEGHQWGLCESDVFQGDRGFLPNSVVVMWLPSPKHFCNPGVKGKAPSSSSEPGPQLPPTLPFQLPRPKTQLHECPPPPALGPPECFPDSMGV